MKSRTFGEAAFGPISLSAAAHPFPMTRLPVEAVRLLGEASKIPPLQAVY
jgi:hypothetical protein